MLPIYTSYSCYPEQNVTRRIAGLTKGCCALTLPSTGSWWNWPCKCQNSGLVGCLSTVWQKSESLHFEFQSPLWVQFLTSNLQQFRITCVLPVLHQVNCVTITCTIYWLQTTEMNKIFWNQCLWCFRSISVSWGPLSSFRYLRAGRSGSTKIVTFFLHSFVNGCDITSLHSAHPKKQSAATALRAFGGWVPCSWLTLLCFNLFQKTGTDKYVVYNLNHCQFPNIFTIKKYLWM